MLAAKLAFDETADEEAFDEVFAEDAPELAAEAEVSADLDSTAPAEFLLLSEEVVSGEELIAALPDIVFEEEPAFETASEEALDEAVSPESSFSDACPPMDST